MLHLGEATRGHRLAAMHALMDADRLDALAFSSAGYFQFATNFAVDVETWERPILCVVPRSGKPFVVLNELSRNHWRFGSEAGRLWADTSYFYAEHRAEQTPRQLRTYEWHKLVADALLAHGLGRARIGWEGDGSQGLKSRLPDCLFVDCSLAARALRRVKSNQEIEVMRAASALSDWGQARYRENIRPGRLVHELDASMAALIFAEAAERFPGSDMSLICFTLSGPASTAPHGDGRSVGARISKGDVLVNIIEPRLNGLYIENERIWFCGAPTPRQIELFEAAKRAIEAGTAAAIVGNPVSAIDRAAHDVFERAGFADLVRHRTGHGMGIGCHEYPEDMAFNQRPLEPNEVYSVEPGLYEWGLGGFRHDDTVVVGDVPEVLTKAPLDLVSQTIL